MSHAYAAYTEECTFGLDEGGICREILPAAGATEAMLAVARRCLGAQYVASLDRHTRGLLLADPKPGTRMLFARVEGDGHIILVRSGPLERFEILGETGTSTSDANDDVPPSSSAETTRYAAPETESFAAEEAQEVDIEEEIEEATGILSHWRPILTALADDDDEAVTRKSPSTLRAFPAPPPQLLLAAAPADVMLPPPPLPPTRLRYRERIA